VNNNLKCPFKHKDRGEDCDKEKCVLWHEGGCVFVQIARGLGMLSEVIRSKQTVKF
jgi:hypothetical protein